MDQQPPEEERFLRNLLDLADLVHELASTCYDAGCEDVNPNLIHMARNYLAGYDGDVLINTFIRNSGGETDETGDPLKSTATGEYWSEIKNRNEVFFLDHAATIFKNLPIDAKHINAFQVFFTAKDEEGEDIVIDEDKDAIWNIFDSLVKICVKYIHRIREVKYKDTGRGLRPEYVHKYYPKIGVRGLAKIWEIDLPLPGQ